VINAGGLENKAADWSFVAQHLALTERGRMSRCLDRLFVGSLSECATAGTNACHSKPSYLDRVGPSRQGAHGNLATSAPAHRTAPFLGKSQQAGGEGATALAELDMIAIGDLL
jgi:hypothetical protein